MTLNDIKDIKKLSKIDRLDWCVWHTTRQGFEYLGVKSNLTVPEIAAISGLEDEVVWKRIKVLETLGYVKQDRETKEWTVTTIDRPF